MTVDFGVAFEQHMLGLRRYAMSLLGDPVEADDLVQECMVRALSRQHVWSDVRDRRAYLFAILHNLFVDQRMKYRRRGPHVPIEDVESFLSCPANQNERLRIRDLRRALDDIPKNYKAVILLIGLEGMSYRQAADALDVPVGTIMSRLSRGREMVRKYMDGGSEAADSVDPFASGALAQCA